jgi:chitodextrinase
MWKAQATCVRFRNVVAPALLAACLAVVPLAFASGGADRKAPSMPTNVHVTAVTASSITLAWDPVRDNKGGTQLAGYDLYRGGVRAGTSPSTTYTFAGLSCGTTSVLGVDAYDLSGNRSPTASVTASTGPCATASPPPPPPPAPTDTSPPTVPGNVRVSSATDTSITLSWTASSDNVGVIGYGLYRGGARVSSSSTTQGTFAGLSCGSSYTLGVDAVDAAGNRSAVATVNATTSACPPTPSGLCPTPMPVGDLPGFTQVFTDNFTTNVPLGSFPQAVSGKWYAYPYSWKDTSGNGTYDPASGLSVHDGTLDMWLHTLANGEHVAEAPVPITVPGSHTYGAGQLYGRFSACFKADAVSGYKTAWLLWPNSENWPNDGEIDFPEGSLTGNIEAFMHWQGGTSGSSQDAYSTSLPEAGAWHVVTIEWTPSYVSFVLDGVQIGRSTDPSRIPATPMHWVLQTETQSSVIPTTASNGHVLVDWVAAWRPS